MVMPSPIVLDDDRGKCGLFGVIVAGGGGGGCAAAAVESLGEDIGCDLAFLHSIYKVACST